MPEFTLIQQICIWALPVLLAITFHELAHGYVAYRCGDNTAKMFGRLTLNPIKHIDPIGTVLLPLLIGVITNFNFVIGYAKPVPVNQSQLRKPRRDMILVTLAGPLTNLIMAFLWAGCFKLATFLNPQSSMAALFLLVTARAGMMINLILAFLNLIPIPPLDGSKVVINLLPAKQAIAYAKLEPFGFLILIVLIFTNVLGYILTPPIYGSLYVLSAIFNL
ncbi:TPA: site-2 protease family protein [Legionella pneumophila subsp. raphaeli]|uniref:site-2 protease family protein n=1 Tax=Legionella pneumophila TaxID=446 RepID=UPI000788112A|nr:site-2 protease family protein [Legionella pneumophila]HAU1190725.1 site-2 protease family protein [Legionella pneumophila]HCO4737666.1 site-2 protease family protein [Legionella pneumophila]HEN5653411.1 site-2 protease family protein [Legionella pneumophila]HEN5662628.1 site-2 protease family protein [Legionella pneumophila]